MRAVELIHTKRRGGELTAEELQWLIRAYTDGELPDYQMAAFLMAVFFQGMTPAEQEVWVDAMLHSGEVLDLSDVEGFKVDKHSTGGVGDKVSLILAPLAVAAGLKVPMISGRGLGHTGGTLDKLESIPGFNVNHGTDRFRELVDKHGCGLIGQTEQIAPADKKLYALRDVTATVECIPLIASSIMSKKLAEGIDALVLDVKTGNGAFMSDFDDACELARTMIAIGARMNRPVRALITDMNQPLGLAVGNALEVIECVEIMRTGEGPADLIEVTLELVAEMMELGGVAKETPEATRAYLMEQLRNGEALRIFKELVAEHGADPACIDDLSLMPTAAGTITLDAWDTGRITHMDTRAIGVASTELGAGRRTKEEDVDHAVGLVFHKRLGDMVEAGEPIATIHYNDAARAPICATALQAAITISSPTTPFDMPPLIKLRIS